LLQLGSAAARATVHVRIKHLDSLLKVVLAHLKEPHRTSGVNDLEEWMRTGDLTYRRMGRALNRRVEILGHQVFEFAWVRPLKLDLFRLAAIFKRARIYVAHVVDAEYFQVVVHSMAYKDAVAAQLLDKGLYLGQSWRFLKPTPPNPMDPRNTAHNITLRVDQCIKHDPPLFIYNSHFAYGHLLVFHLVHLTVDSDKK